MHERASCPIDGEVVYSIIDGVATIAGRNNSNNNRRHKIHRNHNRSQGQPHQGLL